MKGGIETVMLNMLAGGYVMLVLILMILTRKGQPRGRQQVASDDGSFILIF